MVTYLSGLGNRIVVRNSAGTAIEGSLGHIESARFSVDSSTEAKYDVNSGMTAAYNKDSTAQIKADITFRPVDFSTLQLLGTLGASTVTFSTTLREFNLRIYTKEGEYANITSAKFTDGNISFRRGEEMTIDFSADALDAGLVTATLTPSISPLAAMRAEDLVVEYAGVAVASAVSGTINISRNNKVKGGGIREKTSGTRRKPDYISEGRLTITFDIEMEITDSKAWEYAYGSATAISDTRTDTTLELRDQDSTNSLLLTGVRAAAVTKESPNDDDIRTVRLTGVARGGSVTH